MIEPKHFAMVSKAIVTTGAYQAVKYISPKHVLKATRRHKLRKGDSRQEFVFTMGAPNYKDALIIKKAVKAGQKFPLKEITVKHKVYKK